jgi:hypothetical protein
MALRVTDKPVLLIRPDWLLTAGYLLRACIVHTTQVPPDGDENRPRKPNASIACSLVSSTRQFSRGKLGSAGSVTISDVRIPVWWKCGIP